MRELIVEHDAEAVIPCNPTRKKLIPYDAVAYRQRNLIERMFGRLVSGEDLDAGLAGHRRQVPGVPFVIIGHNDHIAWGLTATQGDLQDLFIERFDPTDPDNYLTPEGSREFVVREEIIKVRDAEDIRLRVRESRHGPVISDLFGMPPSIGGPPVRGNVLALATTYLGSDDLTPQAMFRLNRAHDMASFRRALASFHSPLLNILYADREGNTGMTVAGRIPIRGRGKGFVPAPGWTGDYDWRGFVPPADNPKRFNPPAGQVFSANHRIIEDNYPYFITRNWAAPFRAIRIEQLLTSTAKFDLAKAQAMQRDTVSAMAVRLAPLMVGNTKGGDARRQRALALLSKWSGHMDRARPEPAIFTAWLRLLNRRIYGDELAGVLGGYWGFRPQFVFNVLNGQYRWCDDVGTDRRESCGDVLGLALDEALGQLSEMFSGRDMNQWRWGDLHQARFEHPVFSRIRFLDRLSTLRIGTDGGGYTINRGTMRFRGANPFAHIHGPGLRVVYDLADLSNSRFIIATGQSGNFLSPHYGDLLKKWQAGDYIRLNATRPDLVAAAQPNHTLVPK